MEDNRLDNRRVIKNTIMLYGRTLITLCITLFTSRAVLNILGVDNYGVYNVVCGFVGMFYIVSSTLVAATQRYLNFELGKITENHSREVFNSALVIHIAICFIVIVVFETFGLWFLNTELNLPEESIASANFVFQFSVLVFIVNIVRSPFDSVIIAHERMRVFAYISVLEAVLRLMVAYMLLLPWKIDILIVYGFLTLLSSILIFSIYFFYCHRSFDEVRLMMVRKSKYYKGMISFAGYNFAGAASYVFAQQGINMLMNIFFGVIVNAARGITDQVQAAITKFVGDFTTALNPQIVKSYAQGNLDNMINLICYGSKLSYLLFLFFSLPLIIYTPAILKLWLGIVPEYTIFFIRLALIDALLNSLSGPVTTGGFSTGKIKKLSLSIGLIRFAVFPITYLAFTVGASPYFSYYILIACDIMISYVRIHISFNLLGVSERIFYTKVVYKIFPVTVLLSAISYTLGKIFIDNTLISIIGQIMMVCLFTILVSFYFAFSNEERNRILLLLKIRK